MATIVTRAGKGSPLTNTEVDANFTNLNTDKVETSALDQSVLSGATPVFGIADMTLDDTNLVVVDTTNMQTFADGVDDALLKTRGTGVSTSYVSTVAVGGTTFAQPAITGEITSDQGYFEVSYAGATGITVANLSASSTYVYIDNTGTLQQQITIPTREDWSRKVFTMRIAVEDSVILGFEYLNNPIGHYANSVRDLYAYLLAQGIPFKKDQAVTGRATDLGFDIASGSLMEFGGTGDINNPNIKDFSAVSNAQFFLSTRTGFDAGGNTALPKFWDNNGTLTALGSTTLVGHRLYRFSNGNVCLQYGQGNYANITLAKAGVLLENYVLNPALANATFFGWWFIESTATNTGGTTLTDFVEYTIGVQGGSSSALSGALLKGNNLSDLLDAGAARTNMGLGTGDSPTFAGATVTGEITANGGIALGDNDKATFGVSDDLQIFHDGSNSYIEDAGTGSLNIKSNGSFIDIQSNSTRINNAANNEIMATFVANGAVTLNYDNASKLATTATGIDVTGTVVADGLTVSKASGDIATLAGTTVAGDVQANLVFNPVYDVNARIVSAREGAALASTLAFETGVDNTGSTVKRVLIGSGGDVSFYEDTGTTAKMVWSASAERLSVPTLSITDGSITTTAATGDHTVFNSTGADADFRVRTAANTHSVYVQGNTGNVGIGISAPSAQLHLAKAGGTLIKLGTSVNTSEIEAREVGGGQSLILSSVNSADHLVIDGAGNVGIGTSSPDTLLEIVGADPILTIRDTETSGASTNATLRLAESSGGDALGNYWDINHTGGGALAFKSLMGVTANEAMRIDSSGSVGIGTSSPASVLDVRGARPDLLRLYSTATGGDAEIEFLTLNNASSVGKLSKITATQVGADTNGSILAFSTSPTSGNTPVERLRIDSSGSVGIGTSPLTKLHVQDSAGSPQIRIDNQGTASGIASLLFRSGGAGNPSSIIQSGGTSSGNQGIVFKHGDFGAEVERMRIDSSGLVTVKGSGAGSVSDHFRIESTDTQAKLAFTTTTGNGAIYQDGAGLVFATNTANTERMRIDSSGNLLVGKTSSDLGVTAGIELNGQYDVGYFTRSGEKALVLNRLSTDGTIADFRKDGTTVGSIGSVASNYLSIGTGDTGILFQDDNDFIEPCNVGTSAGRDNAISLGHSGGRFKDLHLSGNAFVAGNVQVTAGNGILLGGTAAANKLDDYEEGTWTPAVYGTATAGTATYAIRAGTYTKVGNLVYLQAYLIFSSFTGTSEMRISGLPFTPEGGSYENHMGSIILNNIALPAGSVQVTPRALDGQTFLDLRATVDNAGSTFVSCDAAGEILISITYRSA